MLNRRNLLCILAGCVFLAISSAASAAPPYVNGTYVTPVKKGTFKFTPLRAVVQFGYEGKFVIDGKSYPGSLYFVRGTNKIGMVWYFGVSGIQAGSALVEPVANATTLGLYKGPISFTDRKGKVLDSGTLTVTIK